MEDNVNSKKLIAVAGGLALACSVFAQSNIAEKISSDMVAVEGGTFQMGSRDNENNETPVHEVKINDFSILNTEVTQTQYKAVIGVNYSHFKGAERPVEEVSWYDAIVFCNKLSAMAGLTPVYSLDGETDPDKWGDIPRMDSADEDKARWNTITWNTSADGYRLPTEAEWEYAAIGGLYGSPENLYSGSNIISDVAWNADNPDGETHDVATKAPNSLGLFDMSGNVWEWVWDWYGNYHLADNDNPLGAKADVTGRKMRRGGSINSDAVFCRNANRASSVPELRGVDLGFRVVRSAIVAADSENEEPVVAPAANTVPEEEEDDPLLTVEYDEEDGLDVIIE